MTDKTYHIRERFPDKRDTIIRLVEKDPEFRAVCEDYDDCINALRYWAQSKETEAETRFNEYRNLIRELEKEIIQALLASKPQCSD